MKTILICGLPGSGKTTFAKKLKDLFGNRAIHFNADEVRKEANDWDFSPAGRLRQVGRMRSAAEMARNMGKYAILDFVCPKEEYRNTINADYLVYMDCPPVRNFEDTTAMFERPRSILLHYVSNYKEADETVINLYHNILDSEFNPNAPTALMIGRYQPFHGGHKALFEKALEKHGQVCIAIRDMKTDSKNPYSALEVMDKIHDKLREYRGKYKVVILPNIVDVVYGRDVGWTVSKIDLPPEIEAISATKIRQGTIA